MKLALLVKKLKSRGWEEKTAPGYALYTKKDRECRIHWNKGKYHFIRKHEAVPAPIPPPTPDSVPLTEAQIKNWRTVLFLTLGPFALLMSAKEIERYRTWFNKGLEETRA
jgi:hypothetical protein